MSFQLSNSLVLDGYRLIRFLGRGGFGEVWLCQSEAMGDYRALKFIPTHNSDRLEKEYGALLHYRKAAARLRSPNLVPIEHVNRNEAGLYYVMPLADGCTGVDPLDPRWHPLSLATMIHNRVESPKWFSSREIMELTQPILEALQTLSNAGLVHRDVKPDNILFFNGHPCLGDISLLGVDASVITRRGTVGYAAPSWYMGGHPDMYGAAATLYTMLTGNLPDKMGRSAFLWPPQGEASLSASERDEWRRLHGVIRRASDEKVSERFTDFAALTKIVVADQSAIVPHHSSTDLTETQKADYTALVGMVEGYIAEGAFSNALATVGQLLATYPQARSQPAYSIARAMALQGLGRIDEAKDELKKDIHLSPSISSMAARKKMWLEFGDLPAAEKDITRVLGKFGNNTLVLFFRADVWAQRGDFAGVQADRVTAYATNPTELEQRGLVDDMWTPLETKYPSYGEYLKSLVPVGNAKVPETAEMISEKIAQDDAWVTEQFDAIMSEITDPDNPASESAISVRKIVSEVTEETYRNHDYVKLLEMMDHATETIPALSEKPVLSLFKALLLTRLQRKDDAEGELVRLCHRDGSSRLIEARICLLSALDRKPEAEKLLSRILEGNSSPNVEEVSSEIHLLELRARIRNLLGDIDGSQSDKAEALLKTNLGGLP